MLTFPAAVIITADSVRDGIDQQIKQELVSQHGLRVVFERRCQISKRQVSSIYPRLVHKPFFPALVHNMTSGPSLLVLYEGKDVYEVLRGAKGMFRFKNGSIQKSGIRLKYQGLSKEELGNLGYRGKQLFYRLFEYRIHTSDNQDETIFLCKLFLDHEDYALFEQMGKSIIQS